MVSSFYRNQLPDWQAIDGRKKAAKYCHGEALKARDEYSQEQRERLDFINQSIQQSTRAARLLRSEQAVEKQSDYLLCCG